MCSWSYQTQPTNKALANEQLRSLQAPKILKIALENSLKLRSIQACHLHASQPNALPSITSGGEHSQTLLTLPCYLKTSTTHILQPLRPALVLSRFFASFVTYHISGSQIQMEKLSQSAAAFLTLCSFICLQLAFFYFLPPSCTTALTLVN